MGVNRSLGVAEPSSDVVSCDLRQRHVLHCGIFCCDGGDMGMARLRNVLHDCMEAVVTMYQNSCRVIAVCVLLALMLAVCVRLLSEPRPNIWALGIWPLGVGVAGAALSWALAGITGRGK
jgi:hypothetical protein